jgi:hypothetical protein
MKTSRAVACAAFAGALGACASSDGSAATFTIAGTYAIYGNVGREFTVAANGCTGAGDAGSIGAGTPVTVTDVHDIALATGALSGGVFEPTTAAAVRTERPGVCSFALEVTHVPDHMSYYRLVIGGRRVEQVSSDQAHRRLALAFYAP